MAFPIMGPPDPGDTAWMLTSSALVLLMTPGLAFFYGGMVRAKGVLNMLMMSISAMGSCGPVGALRLLDGIRQRQRPLRFGDPTQYWGMKGLFGGTSAAADRQERPRVALAGTMPQTVFVAFQRCSQSSPSP